MNIIRSSSIQPKIRHEDDPNTYAPAFDTTLEFNVDSVVLVDRHSEWAFEDDSPEWSESAEPDHWFYDEETGAPLGDEQGILDECIYLLDPYIPGDAGRYHITCTILIVFHVDDVVYDWEYGEREVSYDDVDVTILDNECEVRNFSFQNI